MTDGQGSLKSDARWRGTLFLPVCVCVLAKGDNMLVVQLLACVRMLCSVWRTLLRERIAISRSETDIVEMYCQSLCILAGVSLYQISVIFG